MKKNFLYQCAYQLLILALPIVTAPYITRILGVENIGIYSYTFSVVNYFMLFSMLGFNTYGMRAIAQVRNDEKNLSKTFSGIFYMQFFISLIIIIAYVIYLIFFTHRYQFYFFIEIIYVIGCALDINWFYFGIEKFKLTVTRNTIVKIITVICIFCFVKNETDLWKYTIIMALGTIISQIIMWSFIKNYVAFARTSIDEIKKHFMPALILFIPTIAMSVYKIMDKVMLGNMSGAIQVGYFENSEKLINITLSIINALGTVMMTRMSNMVISNNKTENIKCISRFMELIMFIAVAMSFGLISIADKFVPIFYGREFLSAIKLVIGLAITIPISAFASVIRMQYLIPYKMDREYIVSLVIGAIVNLIINFMFIPQYGALGTVFGTIAAEISVCIFHIIFAYKELPINQYIKKTIIFYGMGIVMLLGVKEVTNHISNLYNSIIFSVLTGMVIYVICGFIYVCKRKEKFILKNKFISRGKLDVFKKN